MLASVKVRNLKANHNNKYLGREVVYLGREVVAAVLARMKVRNLKANHNRGLFTTAHLVVMVIGCCSAYG